MRALYEGSDLHGNNNLLGIIDGRGKRVFKKRLPNDPELVRDVFKPYKEEIVGNVVESTYNRFVQCGQAASPQSLCDRLSGEVFSYNEGSMIIGKMKEKRR